MSRPPWNVSFGIMLLADTVAFSLSLLIAFHIRFEFQFGGGGEDQALVFLPVFLIFKLGVFLAYDLYRNFWRYTSTDDAIKLCKAVAVSTGLCYVVLEQFGVAHMPFRSIYLLDGLVTLVFCGSMRLGTRILFTARSCPADWLSLGMCPGYAKVERQKNIVIIGAGNAGEKMFREIIENRELDCRVQAFLDDDPGKRGRSLHGVDVVGSVDDLPRLLQSNPVDEVLIAIPTATGKQMRRIVEICRSCEVKFKTLPGIGEIIDGRVSVKSIREVSYEDLLGRPQVRLDCESIAEYLAGKVVLVTGGGGSIGSEICRQIVRFDPAKLVIVDNGEANLHHIQMELQHEYGYSRVAPVLCRVQDRMLDKIFGRYRPETVFHAAAYKHVPMMEWNPWEAFFNNVLGSKNAMDTARRHRVRRFVLVSTDKAVRPTNVMGASKRITELLLQSMDPGSTRFMAVRFGNVLGSSGSVIPLFRRQIEQGGPVTVTHPDITRYFMSIPEAAKLILQAGALGSGGEIFLLKMGEPIKIADMAEDLIRLSGKKPHEEIELRFTGLRPGEKLYEELITEGEGNVGTQHDKIMILRPEDGLRLRTPDFRAWLDRQITELMSAAFALDGAAVRSRMHAIVPEYAIPDNAAGTSLLHEDGFALPQVEVGMVPLATVSMPHV